jgi:hypothetical protein
MPADQAVLGSRIPTPSERELRQHESMSNQRPLPSLATMQFFQARVVRESAVSLDRGGPGHLKRRSIGTRLALYSIFG